MNDWLSDMSWVTHDRPHMDGLRPLLGHAALPSTMEHAQPPLSDCVVGSPDVKTCLRQLLAQKYRLILAYINWGDQLRAPFRDGVYKHFQEHVTEERQQAYEIAKKITALGDDGHTDNGPLPCPPLDDFRAVVQALLDLEQESVRLWQQLFDVSTGDAALNGMAQDGAVQCQQHADDMARYLRSAA